MHVELRGRRRDGREVIHSRADVVLSGALPKPPTAAKPPSVQPYSHPLDEAYKFFLFHGPELQGVECGGGRLPTTPSSATSYPAPAPSEWFAEPLRSNWVADPLVLDVSFQMMILWSFAQHGAGSLPCFLGRYRQYRRPSPPARFRSPSASPETTAVSPALILTTSTPTSLVVAQVQDYECVIDAGLNQAFRRNQLGPAVRTG